MIGGVLKKRFPGLNKDAMGKAQDELAIAIHARFYGANIDGVDSPLWAGENPKLPNVDASEMLKDVQP